MMKILVTDEDVEKYRADGYFVLPRVIPPLLLRELRREATKAREVGYRVNGARAQRLKPLNRYADEFDLAPFRQFTEIDGLDDAVRKLTSPHHELKPMEEASLLFQPRDRPCATEWQRGWRDNVLDAEFQAEIGDARWQEILNDPDFFNQVRCPLFEDTSTWYVPGSHRRVANTSGELEVRGSATREELRDDDNRRTDEELELYCLGYCEAMPGAVQLVLNPGDFCLYRSPGWHISNFAPYRERMTLHTQAMTPASREFARTFEHLLKPREASLERHAKMAE